MTASQSWEWFPNAGGTAGPRPLIPVQDAAANLDKANFYETFTITDQGVHYVDGNGEPSLAPRALLAGEEFFDFGQLGLCWNQEAL